MVLALAFMLMYSTTAINGVHWGTGKHMTDLSEEEIFKALRVRVAYPSRWKPLTMASIGIFATLHIVLP